MRKRFLQISTIILSFAGSAFSQTADNFILPKHSSTAAADHYGLSISKCNNYTLVGAPEDDSSEDCASRNQSDGAAVLYKDGRVFRKYQGASSTISDTEIGWRAGESVAMGQDWLAIGAPNALIGKGAVLLVTKDNSSGSYDFSLYYKQGLAQPDYVPGVGLASYQNYFGSAVAIGRNTLAIGAKNATYNGISCGVVFIYKLNGVWEHVKTLISPYSTTDGDFGAALALSDDETKLIVGAPAINNNTGAAHIYHLENATYNNWKLKKTFLGNVHKLTRLEFGSSVDITNERAIVGGNKSEGSNSIVSFLTYSSSNGWNVEQNIYKPSVRDVAIEGTKALIGEGWYAGGEGRVVHMERRGHEKYKYWEATATVGLNQDGARTGYSVDLANNVAVAGVYGYDWDDIYDNCYGYSEEHAGGALLYNFDHFNGKFYKSDKSYLRASAEEGVEESFSASEIVVSPNPADKGFVEINSNATITEVIATNVSGISKSLTINNNIADISVLESGIYFLMVKTENGNSVQRLVVK